MPGRCRLAETRGSDLFSQAGSLHVMKKVHYSHHKKSFCRATEKLGLIKYEVKRRWDGVATNNWVMKIKYETILYMVRHWEPHWAIVLSGLNNSKTSSTNLCPSGYLQRHIANLIIPYNLAGLLRYPIVPMPYFLSSGTQTSQAVNYTIPKHLVTESLENIKILHFTTPILTKKG